ncbi:MAG: hypothetical protein QOC57_722, partial [Ilumatobacteraceae bacterium]
PDDERPHEGTSFAEVSPLPDAVPHVAVA